MNGEVDMTDLDALLEIRDAITDELFEQTADHTRELLHNFLMMRRADAGAEWTYRELVGLAWTVAQGSLLRGIKDGRIQVTEPYHADPELIEQRTAERAMDRAVAQERLAHVAAPNPAAKAATPYL